MKHKYLSRCFYLFLSFALLISPLPLSAMVEDVIVLNNDEFEIIDNLKTYVCFDKNLSDIASILSEIGQLDKEEYSPLVMLKRYVEKGLMVASRDDVLQVLDYAHHVIYEYKGDNEYALNLLMKLDRITEDILFGQLNLDKYATMRGIGLKLFKTNVWDNDYDLAQLFNENEFIDESVELYRSSLSLPQVVGFENLFGNPATLYAAADTSATLTAGTTDRTNAVNLVLASDTAAIFGSGTTAFRGWTVTKNASTAELAFQYQNTDTVGQIAVPLFTLVQFDGLNNQVQLPTAATKIVFASDTNLYRSAANTLKTDSNLVVATLTPTGIVHNDASGNLTS